jgi:hypothetical protein
MRRSAIISYINIYTTHTHQQTKKLRSKTGAEISVCTIRRCKSMATVARTNSGGNVSSCDATTNPVTPRRER